MRSLILSLFMTSVASAGEVEVPLADYEAKRAELEALIAKQAAAAQGTDVDIGETTYRGRSDGRNLSMQLELHAQLGSSDSFKAVPIIGTDAVVISATSSGESIPLDVRGDRWVWNTKAKGAVSVTVDFVVAPRGPRGSIEYRFGIVESPVTRLSSYFPFEGLSPRVTGAVTSEVRPAKGGVDMSAVLRPTREVHIVGLYEVKGDEGERPAKVYGETQNLLALSDDGVELFSVVRLTILYAAQRRFRIELPPGFDVVSADGQGAFTYRVETVDHKPVLVGETAFGIRDRYEISLRLERALGAGDSSLVIPMPRLLDVERDTGFVAIEVPGKLSVEKVEGQGLLPIDVRELPAAIVESSVTPIVRALRYADTRGSMAIEIARYSEAPLSSGGIDSLRATTVVTADGRAMTDVRFSIRNNLQQYLALVLDDGVEVKSAAIDGEPIKPSRDEQGRVLVPLVRSKSDAGALVPFRVQLVYEEKLSGLGLAGMTELSMPKLEVPIASLVWKVLTPGGFETTELGGERAQAELVKNASWHQAHGYYDGDGEDAFEDMAQGIDPSISDEHRAALREDRATGAVPVRVTVPEKGNALTFSTYWVDSDRPVRVRFFHARTPVVLLFQVLSTLAMAVLLVASARWSAKRTFAHGGAALLGAGLLSLWASVGWALTLAAVVLSRGQISKLLAGARKLGAANYEAWKTRMSAAKDRAVEGMKSSSGATALGFLGLSVRVVLLAIIGSWFIGQSLSFFALLGRPL